MCFLELLCKARAVPSPGTSRQAECCTNQRAWVSALPKLLVLTLSPASRCLPGKSPRVVQGAGKPPSSLSSCIPQPSRDVSSQSQNDAFARGASTHISTCMVSPTWCHHHGVTDTVGAEPA